MTKANVRILKRLLQWGRGLKTPEIGVAVEGHAERLVASMGPGS